MNPLQRITAYVAGLWQRWGGSGWGRLRYLLPGARKDWEREAGDLWRNSILSIALKWLGDRFPRPILRVSRISRTGDFVPLPRHPAVDLWSKPNPYYTRRTLEKAVGLSLVVDGNAFVWKRRSKGGRLIELWWLPHWALSPVYPADGSRYLDGWNVDIEGTQEFLPADDVIHFRDGIDPRQDRLGLSAVKGQIREICAVNEESGYTASILLNSGVPGLVVVPASDKTMIDQKQGKAVKGQLDDAITGDGRGRTVVMTGAVDLKTIGFSPEQLRIDRLTLTAQARLAASCGTALMSLGLPDPGKTYSNLGEANRSSWGTIVATQELIGETLRWSLLPEFGDDPYKLLFEYDYSLINELQEDLDRLHARAREDWKAGGITLNEYREAIGLEPHDDGDRFYPGTGGEEPEPEPEPQPPPGQPQPDDEPFDLPAALAERNGVAA